MRMRAGILEPGRLAGPFADQPLDQLADRKRIVLVRPEIPGTGVSCTFKKQLLRQGHIAAQAIQDELPRAYRVRIAQDSGTAFVKGIYNVGDELIVSAITAPNNISGTRR